MNARNLGPRIFLHEPDGTLRGVSNQSLNRMVTQRGAIIAH
jgi:hypothetical protein